jgi:hypothetical protein
MELNLQEELKKIQSVKEQVIKEAQQIYAVYNQKEQGIVKLQGQEAYLLDLIKQEEEKKKTDGKQEETVDSLKKTIKL